MSAAVKRPEQKTEPTISVVLATWNGARFLEKQLRSIVAQSRRVDQLVVSDDGSSDETMAICRRYRGEFASFVCRSNEIRLGPTQNFMSALRWTEGDVIALCDQDDIWMPDKVARVVATLTRPDTLAVYHSALLIDDADRTAGIRFPDLEDATSAEVSALRAVYGMGLAFSARLRPLFVGDYVELMRETCGHDYWIYATAMMFGDVAHLAEPLSYYRQHHQNYTGAPRRTAGLVSHGIRRRQYQLISDRMQAVLAALDRWTCDGASSDLTPRENVRQHYEFVRDTYAEKAFLYGEGRHTSVSARLGSVRTLARSQAYRPASRTGLNYRSFVRDCLFAITPARLLMRP